VAERRRITCAYCGRRRVSRGELYCSSRCARKARDRVPGGITGRWMPTDDEVWAERDRPLAYWSERTGLEKRVVSRRLLERGWEKRPGSSRMRWAPCRYCGDRFEVEPEQVERDCGCHGAKQQAPPNPNDPREIFRRELRLYRQRQASKGCVLRRTYTRTPDWNRRSIIRSLNRRR